MTDDVLPDFGRSDDMVLPVFDRGALAVAEQEQQRQRGEPNLTAPAYPPALDLGFGGPARSQMTFGENVAGSFFTNTLPGVIGEAASNEAARGNVQPGGFQPSQLRNLPSRVRQRIEAESPEDAAARREAAYQRVFDQAAYDLSQSRITPQSVAGTVVGALADPVNVVSLPANALRRGAAAVAGRFGPASGRVAESAIDAAVTNTAIDPILQAGRIQSGGQEGYNPEQTALAPVVGGAAGALLRGAIEAPSFARMEAQAFGVDPARIETPQPVGTEAAGAPAGAAGEARIATPEAPIAREGQTVPDAGPVQRQAEAVSPEPARIEAPAGQPVDRGAAVEADAAPAREIPAVREDAAPEPPQARVEPIGEAVASIPQHRVATTAGSSIEVVPVVVEASAVRASSDAGYDASIQPRDRDRAASQAQIREMASRLDPERLGFSSEADRGAPIVGPDGMVESGNGRVMAIRQAYAAGGEAAQRYRDWLTRQGVDVSRFREPVIVRQRITDLTPEQRARFAVEANQAATLQMSAAERAIADARMMSADMFDLLRDPSNLMAAANRDFVRAFVRGLPQTEQGSLVDAGGILSQEGASRVRNAVLASAYGDSPVLTRVSESTDDNAKSLSNGLVMAAPEWARLKADIGSGRVPAEFDLTPQLMEAVTRTIDLRSRGMNLKAYMAQMDAFDRLTDNVDRFMRMFYDPKGSRAASAERISDAVRFYAQEARKVSADMGLDLGLARVTPDEIQGASLGRGQNEGQQNLFGSGARDGEGGDQGRFAALGQSTGSRGEAGEVARDTLRQWKSSSAFASIDEALAAAPANQRALADASKAIADDLGIEFKNPGIKKDVDRIRQKVAERQGNIGAVTDIVRGGFLINKPDDANQIVRRLAQAFDLVDEGWFKTDVGYFDRKIVVRFEDGQLGEIQIWEPSLLKAKNERGHDLYTKSRSMEPGPERNAIDAEATRLYSAAFAGLADDWKAAVGSGGTEPKRFLKAASSGSTPALNRSSDSLNGVQASPQKTQPPEGVRAAGSPSNDRNLTSAIKTSDDTLAQNIEDGNSTSTPAFKRWFGDSVVRNKDGTPQVVYHGTASEFSEFSTEFSQKKAFFVTPRPEDADLFASGALKRPGQSGANIMPLYVSLQRPFERGNIPEAHIRQLAEEFSGAPWLNKRENEAAVRRAIKAMKSGDFDNVTGPADGFPFEQAVAALKRLGYDGILNRNPDGSIRVYAVFDPTQLKSVNNKGGFDPADPNIAAMARQTADTTADRRFPGRQELPGEASKPRSLPENIRPEDIRDFRVTELMRDIAARMDRKLEVDRNFSIRGAEGQYDFKQGVLRIRKEGDYEVFSHELGHAIEQQLRRDVGKPLDALLRAHAAELKRLDVNADDPAKQTVREGFAEFVRRLINNPAYAAKQAPGFAPEFARLLESAPQIRDIINDATLISRIDGGLDPVQSIKSTIAPAVEPRGVKKFMDEWRRSNLPVTMSLWADRAYAATVDRGHWVKRFVQTLTEARFKKTGRPMSEFGWSDPTKMFRALDGAKQAAVDAFQNGVRDYGRALDGPVSPSLHAALKEAGGGSIGRMLDERSEGYRDFNAYLIARRSLGEYQRFREGDLPSPPVRQTENEIIQAIAALEAANPTFRSAADKVFGFSRAMLRKKFEAGLVSKEFYDAVTARGMDYVPFFRDMMDGETRSGGGGSNGVQQGLEGQRFRGSTRDILDPIQSLMLDTARSERVIALNDFWTAMHRLAKQGGEFSGRFLEEIPNSKLKGVSIDVEEALKAKARERGLSPEDTQNLISSLEEMVGEDMTATLFRSQEITPGGERIVFRYEGGQRIAMKLGSDEYSRGLFEVMQGMSAAERDVMLAMFGKANAMFAQFITNAPQFALKNLVMDNLSRLFVARHTGVLGRIPFASLAQGIYTHIFDREFSKAYAAMGGIRGGVVSAASRDLERTGGLEALSLTPQGTMGTLRDMVGNVQSPTDALKAGAAAIGKGVEGYFKLIEATETAGRLGQARFVFNHLKKQGLDDYQAMHAAIYEARDVLDYDRRGKSMTVANRFMPFFNVGIQGIDRGLRNLVSDPLAAAIQAYQRGGYANVDEAGKTALRDAVINWGMIAAAAVVTLGYHAAVSDDPVYRRQSDYMRKRYFILPMGQDASGRDFFISVPKPFDLPGGILSAVEAAADGIKRADPEAYGRVAKSLAEGFIPRQLAGFVEGPRSGVQDFLGAQPLPKVGFEAVTGKRLGFEGAQATDIIPMGLRGLMPADQWTGNTSFLAKRIGAATGASPLMIDHIMNGLGATAARDFNDVMTATFDNNPNMTPQDAYTKLFFGGLYRGARGVGSDRSEVTQLMGRDGAKYMAPALSYAAAIERGDTTRSEQIYQSTDSIGKALMTLRGHSFAPAERQLHPLQSAETWAATVGAITRDLSQNRIEVQNRSRRRGEQRETIDLEPGVARSIINTMNAMAAEEIRNGLSTAGIPGYQGLPVIDTKARLDAIRALNPQVADEIQNRISRAHIIPAEVLREKWPEVQRRLSNDRQLATLNDLLPAGASQAARRAAGRSLRTRQRVEESNNSD